MELTPLFFSTNMSSFQRQLSCLPPRKSRVGSSRPPDPSSTPAPVTSPASRSQQVQISTAGPLNRPEKRKQANEIDLANPPAVSPESVMAATRGAAREALAEQVGLQRRTEIMASQPGVLEWYTSNPELSEVVKKLPVYLQLMVTLMTMMVPLIEESKL